MFTAQAPFLYSTLNRSTDPTTAAQLTQAFANCNQPLTHRAGVSLQPSSAAQRGGVLNARFGPSNYAYAGGALASSAGNDRTAQLQPWAISRNNYYGADANSTNIYNAYRPGQEWWSAYPDQAADAFYNTNQSFEFGPITNKNNSNWYTRMGDLNTFDFSIRQGDVVNNFGGPTFQVAGDSYFDNSVHNTQEVTEQSVTNQNVTNQTTENSTFNNVTFVTGDPAQAGPQGPQGFPGQPGQDGADGLPGPPIKLPPKRVQFQLQVDTQQIQVLTGATFNPDTCFVELTKVPVKYVTGVKILVPRGGVLDYYGP
jgi:hypothetical protein